MRRSPWRSPRGLWRIRLRRAVGQTRIGYRLKRLLRRCSDARSAYTAARTPQAVRSPRNGSRRGQRNVLLVSHCDFTGNSALHVYCVARELDSRGFSPAIAVPGNAAGVSILGRPSFPVLDYRDVRRGRLRFSDGRGVGLVHAFTPRDIVRELTVGLVERHGCPYVVHLEDNEDAIVGGDAHPARAREFVAEASGITVVIERLLELKPESTPAAVTWPGFDDAVLAPRRSRVEVRKLLGLGQEHLAIVYTGNIHESNLAEMRELYLAISRLREAGHEAALVKTGWNFVPSSALPGLGDGLRHLGWVAREDVAELLSAADVLVQPGRADAFNDYRFPSKLPEFLASGRPVVLPRTNIGLHLRDGVEALLLDLGDADEIAAKVALLAGDPDLAARVGEAGRAFALRELRWSTSADRIVELYRLITEGEATPSGVGQEPPG